MQAEKVDKEMVRRAITNRNKMGMNWIRKQYGIYPLIRWDGLGQDKMIW